MISIYRKLWYDDDCTAIIMARDGECTQAVHVEQWQEQETSVVWSDDTGGAASKTLFRYKKIRF